MYSKHDARNKTKQKTNKQTNKKQNKNKNKNTVYHALNNVFRYHVYQVYHTHLAYTVFYTVQY